MEPTTPHTLPNEAAPPSASAPDETMAEVPVYGLLAEFETPEAVRAAAEAAYAAGYRRMDAYSPFPVEGLAEAVGFRKNRMPLVALSGGVLGGLTGYVMQWYANVIGYPLNIGGRPHHSWPSFIPITFELTVLFAGFFALFGLLIASQLPQPYHPVFNAARFLHASQDRFFLCLEASDPTFDATATHAFLHAQGAVTISEVEP